MTKQELLNKMNDTRFSKAAEEKLYTDTVQRLVDVQTRLREQFLQLEVTELTSDVRNTFQEQPGKKFHFTEPPTKHYGHPRTLYFDQFGFGFIGSSIAISYFSNNTDLSKHPLHVNITRKNYPDAQRLAVIANLLHDYEDLYASVTKNLPELYDRLSSNFEQSAQTTLLKSIFADFDETPPERKINIERLCYNLYLCDKLKAVAPEYFSAMTAAYYLQQSKNKVSEGYEEWMLEKTLKANSFSAFLTDDFLNEKYMAHLLAPYNQEIIDAYRDRVCEYIDPQYEYDDYQRE